MKKQGKLEKKKIYRVVVRGWDISISDISGERRGGGQV